MKNVVDLNWINLIYVIFWGVISFISSFTGILDLDCRQVVSQNLLKDVLNPVFIWIIAFFGDYLYSVFSLKRIPKYWMRDGQKYHTYWWKAFL